MSEDLEPVAYLVALSQLPGIGPATLLRCRSHADPARLWAEVVAGRAGRVAELAEALANERKRTAGCSPARLGQVAAALDPGEELARHRADGREVLLLGTPAYPSRLQDDPAPPALLFAEGDLALLEAPTVAIVGTRNATRAGRVFAAELAEGLARAGVSVVSGLALGIDGAAHQGMLDAPVVSAVGRPIGVIASGLDVAYPTRHARLHRDVVRNGVLVSETPLGERPSAWRFPARNRIIAGLSDAVVVVESRSRGGSMLTAAEAVARDVPLLAVPGHPGAPAAAGTNDLIYDGALLLRDLEDVLVAIGRGGTAVSRTRPDRASGLPLAEVTADPDQRSVLAVLEVEPLALDELVSRSGLTVGAAAVALSRLESAGAVSRTGGWYERVR